MQPTDFQKIRRIQILSNQLAKDVLAGMYRSAFKGKGIEFEEVREYEPGDEIRSIDWNVTARMSRPFVKNFREERDLTVLLVVDISSSLHFGSYKETKSEYVAELAAVLAFSAIKNNDRVGLILFSGVVEKYVPPKKGVRHVLRVIREILMFKPKHEGSDLKTALAFLGRLPIHSGICFVISDFFCPDFSHEATLMAQKHDLIGISIRDPHEREFPRIGLSHIADLETKETAWVDADALQEDFQKQAQNRLVANKYLLQRIGGSFIDLSTNVPFDGELRKFFRQRARQRQ